MCDTLENGPGDRIKGNLGGALRHPRSRISQRDACKLQLWASGPKGSPPASRVGGLRPGMVADQSRIQDPGTPFHLIFCFVNSDSLWFHLPKRFRIHHPESPISH